MTNIQKDKTARIAKERDYYKTELDTLRALVATEQEASAKEKRAMIDSYEKELHSAAAQLNRLDGRLAFESEQRRAARLETASLRLTMVEKEQAYSAIPGSSSASAAAAVGVVYPTVGTSVPPVSAQSAPLSSPTSSARTPP